MIPLVYEQSIVNDLLWGLSSYKFHKELVYGEKVTLPFVKADQGVPVINFFEVEKINNSTAKTVMIDMATEGFDSMSRAKLSPAKKYILLSNGTWNVERFNFGLDYDLLNWNYMLYSTHRRLMDFRYIDYFQDRDYNFTGPKPFTFSAFVGRQSPERDLLAHTLKNNVTNTNYVLNYKGQEWGQPSRQLDFNYDFAKISHSDSLNDAQFDHHFWIGNSIPIRIYNSSKFLLVCETSMSEHDDFHLSEKTVKALVTGAPFVLMGSYRFLAQLRQLGFRTYNEVWSEDYDEIANVNQRVVAVTDLVNKLSAQEWTSQTIDKLKEIAYHNKMTLMNINLLMEKQFDIIIKQFAGKTYNV